MKNADKIIDEAKKRFDACAKWEAQARKLFLEDYKFGHGDSDNGFQWPGELMRARQLESRPALTINKTRQHCLHILNDMRQNEVGIQMRPAGDNATYEAAQVLEDIVRHIEDQSTAQDVYLTAAQHQVFGGWGYWRVVTDYISPDSFDQEIYIRRIADPLTVYLDPDITTVEGSDARFGFVFVEMPRDLFEKKYPQYKNMPARSPLGVSGDAWITQETVRVAEYYRRIEKRDRLYALQDGTTVRRSKLPSEVYQPLEADIDTQKRDIIDNAVEWYLIVGDEIAETREWPGKYIPLVRVIGEETVINGVLDRKGHVRALKDPQRMYNYWSSASVEYAALQSKAPYVTAIESTEGVEQYWETANRVNHAYLPYKSFRDDGQPIPPPQRPLPPQIPAGFVQAMAAAGQEMQMVSGQYESQMGLPSNEQTGIAIAQRQRRGDNATFHYLDQLACGIRYTGRILLDLIPKIYDTPRVLKIVAENGEERTIQIDPSSNVPYAEHVQGQNQAIRRVLNPAIGRYEVDVDVGPGYATRRQEAFAALTQLAAQAPIIMETAADLVMRAADFPMADELAERLKRMVPPQALGGPSPQQLQLQQQLQQMQATIAQLVQSLADQKALTRERSQQKDIDVYKAETDRLSTLGKIDPGALIPVVRQVVEEALQQHMASVIGASQPSLTDAAQADRTAPVERALP